MKKIIVAASLVVLLGGTAIAQSGAKGSSTSSGATSGTVPQAPIGHRQPRAGDVPSEKSLNDPNNPVNKEDALLDKKIKSICRGC